MSVYRDLERDEVRMLKIIDPPDLDKSNLVHCVLEHCSLDDFTPDFDHFLWERGETCNPGILSDWVEFSGTALRKLSTDDISLPSWRLDMHYNDLENTCMKWNDTMEALDMHRFWSARLVPSPHLLMLARSTAAESSNKREHFCVMPRFRWGDFEAVSYCWESEIRDKNIILNGTLFAVPTNLDALLQRLRRLRDAKSGMKFWIDALCINQKNIEERNHQVMLMQRIYSRSFAVIAWLGVAADESERAIDSMAGITHYTLNKGDSWGKGGYRPVFKDKDAKEIDRDLRDVPWNALLSFFSRSYWQRLWIIQELALNHHMTLFLCGERQLPRSMIRRSCEFCMRHSIRIDQIIAEDTGRQRRTTSSQAGRIWPIVYQLESLITMLEQPAEVETLDVILDLGRKARVTDSRDKVYGLLGILPMSLATEIRPDYQLSQEKVYCRFARSMLQESRSMDPIFSWCSFKDKTSWPSWIPDWTTEFARNRVQWLRMRKASGSAPAIWSISNDGRQLSCRGFIVDKVWSTSGSPSESIPYSTEAPRASKVSHITFPSNRYGDKQNLWEALRRTLLIWDHAKEPQSPLNIYWIDGNDITNTIQIIKDWGGMGNVIKNPFWESFDRFRQTNAEFSIFGHSFRDFFPKMPDVRDGKADPEILSKEIGRDMATCVLTVVGRRIMTTKSGFLGLAPEALQKGDEIAVIYGCNFPVVLRKYGEMYRVIGESYVDGIMDGELMEAKERGEYKEVELTFC
jgi:hypothetical protein